MASGLNMRPGGPRPRYRGALAAWLVLATVPAAAQVSPLSGQTLFYHQAGANYGGNYLAVDGGAIYSDNVVGVAGGSGDTLLMLGLSGDLSREGSRFDYHLSSNLALLKYLSATYATTPTGFLDGLVSLKIVPGFFSWLARDTYSQVPIDIYAPVTPQNLVNMNFFTTGPRFTLRPTLRTSVTLDALYSYLNTSSPSYINTGSPSAQYTSFDNQRYGGDLTIDRAFSETASLYLKAEYTKVEFKDQVANNNYSTGTAEGGYKLTDGRTALDVSGGYSQVRIYDVLSSVEGIGGTRETRQTEEFDDPVWKLQLSRLITPTQRVGLSASQQFIDAAAAFQSGFDAAAPSTAPPLLGSGAVFQERQFGLDWRIQGVRTSFDISLSKVTSHYLIAGTNDFDAKTANALLTRQLSPVLKWDIGVSYMRLSQLGTPSAGVAAQAAKEFGALTNLNWQVGEHLALRFMYAYSDWAGLSTNQVGVIASWAFIAPQATTGQAVPSLSPISPVSTLAH